MLMAKNLKKLLYANPEQEEILVIVGLAHCKGMKNLISRW